MRGYFSENIFDSQGQMMWDTHSGPVLPCYSPLPLANVFDATSSRESSSRTDSGPAVMWGLARLILFSKGDGTSFIPKTSSPK